MISEYNVTCCVVNNEVSFDQVSMGPSLPMDRHQVGRHTQWRGRKEKTEASFPG